MHVCPHKSIRRVISPSKFCVSTPLKSICCWAHWFRMVNCRVQIRCRTEKYTHSTGQSLDTRPVPSVCTKLHAISYFWSTSGSHVKCAKMTVFCILRLSATPFQVTVELEFIAFIDCRQNLCDCCCSVRLASLACLVSDSRRSECCQATSILCGTTVLLIVAPRVVFKMFKHSPLLEWTCAIA